MLSLAVSLPLVLPLGDTTIDYTVTEEGPRTIYRGTARLHLDGPGSSPCLSYCFSLPQGALSGPVISSDPLEPLLPFDWWELEGNELEVLWCRPQGSMADLQVYPVDVPRHFEFHIIKQSFNGDDLAALLNDWGPATTIWQVGTIVSPWDFNGDTVVNGEDLAYLLGRWKID